MHPGHLDRDIGVVASASVDGDEGRREERGERVTKNDHGAAAPRFLCLLDHPSRYDSVTWR